VYSVVTGNKRLFVTDRSDCGVFLLLEYDFYLIKRTEVDFATQIQINKYIRKLSRLSDPMNPTSIQQSALAYLTENIGISSTKRDHVQQGHLQIFLFQLTFVIRDLVTFKAPNLYIKITLKINLLMALYTSGNV
jgi:hypothetical protein